MGLLDLVEAVVAVLPRLLLVGEVARHHRTVDPEAVAVETQSESVVETALVAQTEGSYETAEEETLQVLARTKVVENNRSHNRLLLLHTPK